MTVTAPSSSPSRRSTVAADGGPDLARERHERVAGPGDDPQT